VTEREKAKLGQGDRGSGLWPASQQSRELCNSWGILTVLSQASVNAIESHAPAPAAQPLPRGLIFSLFAHTIAQRRPVNLEFL
jgi:hypothetical protein